ncbi:cytochrome P450 [Biscogniauxia mediterranea]|nr:cytochrome P450 [Biscogniauxia mediterranea]
MADGDRLGLLALLFPDGILSSRTALLCVFLTCAYVVVTVTYALVLDPLSKFPGPKLCALSRIPYWLETIKGTDVQWMYNLHRKYGPEVRFGPVDVSFTTAQAWKEINGTEKGRPDNEKAPDFSQQPANGVPSLLNNTYQDHSRVRRLFSPAFSERALRKQEPLFRKYADMLVSKLGELGGDGTPVEMTRLFNFAAFDTMAELCFGNPLGLLENNEFSPWLKAIFDSLKIIPYTSIVAYCPSLRALLALFEPKWLTEYRMVLYKHTADRVDQRLKEGSEKPDIWSLVVAAQESDSKLSLLEMHSNAELFMIAGSETTGTLLSGAMYYLLRNPDKMERLLSEIRHGFTDAKDMSFDTLANLKYLNACLKEALRVYPPIPVGSPRVIPEGGGQIITGRWIPPGTRVSVHHYSTYHSPANFKDPDSFVPERWLGDPLYADDALEAHQPFSWGPRNCLGQSMAMHEMRLMLAKLLFSFDFELCDENQKWTDQRVYSLWIKNPLMCRIKAVGK